MKANTMTWDKEKDILAGMDKYITKTIMITVALDKKDKYINDNA